MIVTLYEQIIVTVQDNLERANGRIQHCNSPARDGRFVSLRGNKTRLGMKDSDAFSTRLRTPTPSEMKGGRDAD